MKGPKPIDLSGQRFGRLVAQDYLGHRHWLCLCDCGTQTRVHSSNLRRSTRSCGCLRIEQAKSIPHPSRHGHSMRSGNTGTYRSWKAMRTRCLNPNSPTFERYGELGVTVCARWDVFENFLADMGERPDGLTLDRIDPHGNYAPGNCRWADAHTQRINRRSKP